MKFPHQTVVWSGTHLEMVVRDGWEYARRKGICGIVGVVAVTQEGKLVLVEQYRPPVDAPVIELPAGLAGDAGTAGEALETAARRELLEETGYQARQWRRLFEGVASAGLSDERMTFFHAAGLRKIAPGGGAGNEKILIHEVPIAELPAWLARQSQHGRLIDLKVYSALAVAAGLL